MSQVGQVTIIPRGIQFQLSASAPLSNITADAYIEEVGEDTAQISDHPVEQGSVISDNIIDLPQELTIVYGWDPASPLNSSQSPSYLRGVYASLIALKLAKIPFTVYTGKRVYTNMVFRSISQTTDKETENCLMIRAAIRELITVSTSTFTIPGTTGPAWAVNPNLLNVRNPGVTMATLKNGQKSLTQVQLTPAQENLLLSNPFSGAKNNPNFP